MEKNQIFIGGNLRYDVFKHTYFPFLQSSRNSISPEDPLLCEDYSRYCNFLSRANSLDGHFWLTWLYHESENNWILNSSYEDVSDFKKSLSGMKYLTSWRISFPCSVREILALTSIEAALDKIYTEFLETPTLREWDEKMQLYTYNFIQNAMRYSLIMDKDPKIIIPYEKIKKVSNFMAHEILCEKGGFTEVTEQMAKEGLLQIVSVDKYWPVFMEIINGKLAELNLPTDTREIIKKDLPTKYGTKTLRKMVESDPYEEVVRKSWENLVDGKRWIS